ncbi:type III PLP-dependent enzyme [Amycolatopsis dendrobii]|uniref:type III PLP-dependent enzyme n=1 Tax=Amycolatopsis dendrobii TaxID=2760662 RepID=UPI0028A8100C|nr:type III PLP-dependent enzyme [Amycolatopsis dendrobii]
MTDLLSVADEAGTPCYVYDLADLRAGRQSLLAALPARAELRYALSANPHPELLREIREAGVLPAVRSSGELDAALVAGWPGRDVLYTGPARRDADLEWALGLGVRTFAVDSPVALDQLARRAAGRPVRCLLRVNACGSVRAGADPDAVFAEPSRFTGRDGVRVVGLHVCADADADSAADLTGRLISVLAREGGPVERVGFTGFAPRFAHLLAGGPFVSFEVDRELVGSAATLVTAVLDVRFSGGGQTAVLESGANHIGPFAGRHRRPLTPKLISRPLSGDLVDTVLIGPQETPFDVWAPALRLPPLRPGDVLAVPDLGAWGVTAGLAAFSGADLPSEVVVDRDDPGAGVVHVSRLSVARYP